MPTARPANFFRAARPWLAAATPLASLLLVGAGCARNSADAGAKLEPSDFRAAAPQPGSTAANGRSDGIGEGWAVAPPTTSIVAKRPIRMIAMSEASAGVLDVSVVPGPPPTGGLTPTASGAAITLDSKVGEINGQPIIASKFLEPLDGRLRAVAQKHAGKPQAWMAEAQPIVLRALLDQVRDELILAEAYSSVKPQVGEAGLRAFLAQIRQDLVRENDGSEMVADERLREQEGMTIDQKSKDSLNKGLISSEIQRRVMPRVFVSSRDQREYYDKNYERFNPPGTAKLRVIMLGAQDAAAAERVAAALAAGTSFEEAARLEGNRFRRDEGGEHIVPVAGLYEEASFFGVPELNDAARALEPGGTIGPVTTPDTVAWLHLESIDRPQGVSFYDAQVEINFILMQQQYAIEEVRYLAGLETRGSFSDIETTGRRLLAIATERYFLGAQ